VTRVLVIDSDPEHRRQLSGILEAAGFTVAGAAAGEQVALLARDADAVILDESSIGRQYGQELHRSLRAGVRTARLPILLIGWHATCRDLEAGPAGGSYYLTRPFTASGLLARLSHLMVHTAVATAALAGLGGAVRTGQSGTGGPVTLPRSEPAEPAAPPARAGPPLSTRSGTPRR
jgi:DNA-binding response OmpR family regulator